MRTRPLTLLAVGLMLVVLDFRVVAFDVFPDVVGWLLIAAASWRLAVRLPCALAVVAALASAADVVTPYHYEATSPFAMRWFPAIHALTNPTPGLVYPERLEYSLLEGVRLGLALLAMVAGGLAVWSILGALRDRANAARERQATGRLTVLRWLVLLLWTAPYVGVAVAQAAGDDGGFDPVWNGTHEVLALVGLAAMANVAWLLVVNSNRAWAVKGDGRINPWAEMIVNDPS